MTIAKRALSIVMVMALACPVVGMAQTFDLDSNPALLAEVQAGDLSRIERMYWRMGETSGNYTNEVDVVIGTVPQFKTPVSSFGVTRQGSPAATYTYTIAVGQMSVTQNGQEQIIGTQVPATLVIDVPETIAEQTKYAQLCWRVVGMPPTMDDSCHPEEVVRVFE